MPLPDPVRGGGSGESCRACGYSLAGLPLGAPCPECGRDHGDPTVGEGVAACLGCGYSLSGLEAYGRCPECGILMPDPALTVRVYGTAKSQESKLWRRVVWALLAVYGVVFSQAYLFMLMRGYAWLVVFLLVGLVAGIVGMVLTGTSGKSGVECFSFTTAGLGRSPVKAGVGASSFRAWRGRTVVDFKRVGAMWSKVKVFSFVGGKRELILDAGVRCPDAHREWVIAAIHDAIEADREDRMIRENEAAASGESRG